MQKSTASSLGVGDRERQRRHHAALLARHHADLPVVQAAQPAHDRQSDAAAQRMFGVGTAVAAFEQACGVFRRQAGAGVDDLRSEAHTSELQSLMRTSYAVFFLIKKNTNYVNNQTQL